MLPSALMRALLLLVAIAVTASSPPAQERGTAPGDLSADLSAVASAQAEALAKVEHSIWLRSAASQWDHALPVGNGRLGAMVFGTVNRERIQLNEETLWMGGPRDTDNPEARAALPEVRRLLFAGQPREAYALAERKLMGKPWRLESYQSLGDLRLNFDHEGEIADYRRELDLDTAIARVTYRVDGVRYTREVFASHPDQVIVVRLTVDRPGRAVLRHLDRSTAGRAHRDRRQRSARPRRRSLPAEGPVVPRLGEGDGATAGRRRRSRSASSSRTPTRRPSSWPRHQLQGQQPPDQVRARSDARGARSPTRNCSRRTSPIISASSAAWRCASAPPAPPRSLCRRTSGSMRVKHGASDPGLDALYFQFGRYLLIASSRPGDLPANLQGLWNDSMSPPWDTRLPPQHQPADELLAGRGDQPRRAARAAVRFPRFAARAGPQDGARALRRARVRRPSHHRRLGLHVAGRSAALGAVADGRGLARPASVGALPVRAAIARSWRGRTRS